MVGPFLFDEFEMVIDEILRSRELPDAGLGGPEDGFGDSSKQQPFPPSGR
jgi:hypothetical protein